jgi:hypothetical protein
MCHCSETGTGPPALSFFSSYLAKTGLLCYIKIQGKKAADILYGFLPHIIHMVQLNTAKGG